MLENLIETINNAESILIFAGAGMSADSNLTTYQDKEGFYNDYPLYRELKKNYISMMSYHGLLDDPVL
jgi:NAD-dependent SIR2 family protein deacetylase